MQGSSGRPVPGGFTPAAAKAERSLWPEGALEQAEQLHRSLSISERDWHALKNQRPRRAAEQIAAALVQLLARDQPALTSSTEGREQAITLLEHAVGWLKAEISDPGCPSHGR
ncbi:MAG: DUF6439 family protein [Synechococcus sp. ELA057]